MTDYNESGWVWKGAAVIMTKLVDWSLGKVWHILLFVSLIIAIEIPPTLLSIFDTVAQQPNSQTWSWIIGCTYFLSFGLIIELASQIFRHYSHLYQLNKLDRSDYGLVLMAYGAIILAETLWTIVDRLAFNETITANNVAIYNLMSANPIALWMMLFSALFLTPIAEELIFRGILMNLFFKSSWFKIFLSAVVFGLVHRSNNLASFLIYFSMGFVLAWVYQYSGKIQNAIWIHFLINLGAMLSMLPSLI